MFHQSILTIYWCKFYVKIAHRALIINFPIGAKRKRVYRFQPVNQFFLKNIETLGRVKNFIFKSLRIESMNYCFKSPPPKFQPQIRSKIAHSIKKVKQGFHRFIWRIKKLLLSNSVTLSVLSVKFSFCRFFCNVGFLKNLFECFYNCCNL